MIRVLHFADVINRYDFIDNLYRFLDPTKFDLGICLVAEGNIFRKVYRLAIDLRRNKYDILHTHHFEPTIVGLLAARIAGTKHVVFGQHYSTELYHIKNPIKRFTYFQIEKLLHRYASAIVVPSKMNHKRLEKQNAPMEKLHVIYYGLDFDRFKTPSQSEKIKLRKELELEGRFVVATIARLVPQKGHRHLFEAIKRLKDSCREILWLIVGDGPERARLEVEFRQNGMGRHIRFLGYREDVLNIISASDAVVQPSLQDSFCQVTVEAMAMRTPIVMTRIGAAEELIEDGRTGILVDQGNSMHLASEIECLIAWPGWRSEMADAGYRSIRKLVDIRDIVKKTEELYIELHNQN